MRLECPRLGISGIYRLSPVEIAKLRGKVILADMGNSDSKELAISPNSTPTKLGSTPSCSPVSKASNCSSVGHQKYYRSAEKQQYRYDSLETVAGGTLRLTSSPPLHRSHKRFCSTAGSSRVVMSAPTSVAQINSFTLDSTYQRHGTKPFSTLKTPPTNFYRKSFTGGFSSNETSTNGSRDDEEFLTCSFSKSHPGGVAEVILLQQQQQQKQVRLLIKENQHLAIAPNSVFCYLS